VKLDVKQIGGFEVSARDSTTVDVQNQLSDLTKLIPSSGRRGIIVVDEANRLKGLAAADSKASLIDLFVAANYVRVLRQFFRRPLLSSWTSL
jgi:hypothetical protein